MLEFRQIRAPEVVVVVAPRRTRSRGAFLDVMKAAREYWRRRDENNPDEMRQRAESSAGRKLRNLRK